MNAPSKLASFTSGSRLQAYLRLVRLPNVFTAVADIMMGYLVTHPNLEPWGWFALLATSSGLLYSAGMVLNDVFDVEVDRAERPFRPIPSGRVSLGFARMLGWELLVVGVALGFVASYFANELRAGIVATVLAGCIWLYDGLLKRTPVAPLAMGACRGLNVLLGMSLAPYAWETFHMLIAGGILVYITGVTWLARTEARQSSRLQLGLATLVMVSGMGLLAWFPSWSKGNIQAPANWEMFWWMLGALVAWRSLRAVVNPTPALVQVAVKQAILSLIVLDGAVTYAARGPSWAIAVLALLVPTMFLGKWIYST